MTKEKLQQAQDILKDIDYLKSISVTSGYSRNCCSKDTGDPTKETHEFIFKIHQLRCDSLNKSIKGKITELEKRFEKL